MKICSGGTRDMGKWSGERRSYGEYEGIKTMPGMWEHENSRGQSRAIMDIW